MPEEDIDLSCQFHNLYLLIPRKRPVADQHGWPALYEVPIVSIGINVSVRHNELYRLVGSVSFW